MAIWCHTSHYQRLRCVFNALAWDIKTSPDAISISHTSPSATPVSVPWMTSIYRASTEMALRTAMSSECDMFNKNESEMIEILNAQKTNGIFLWMIFPMGKKSSLPLSLSLCRPKENCSASSTYSVGCETLNYVYDVKQLHYSILHSYGDSYFILFFSLIYREYGFFLFTLVGNNLPIEFITIVSILCLFDCVRTCVCVYVCLSFWNRLASVVEFWFTENHWPHSVNHSDLFTLSSLEWVRMENNVHRWIVSIFPSVSVSSVE